MKAGGRGGRVREGAQIPVLFFSCADINQSEGGSGGERG
jgi:hypothetical protein